MCKCDAAVAATDAQDVAWGAQERCDGLDAAVARLERALRVYINEAVVGPHHARNKAVAELEKK